MRHLLGLLGLLGPLIFLALHAYAEEVPKEEQGLKQWPYNLPPHVKLWPEDPPHRRRDLEVIEEYVRRGKKPVGVKKMSTDESEMFWPEYWQFEDDLEPSTLPELTNWNAPIQARTEDDDALLSINASTLYFRPPFALHMESEEDLDYLEERRSSWLESKRDSAQVLDHLEKRGFTCPTGTNSCSSIGYPNSCCTVDETCFVIQDTGLGPVGCCPNGSTCGGTITTCAAGNTGCPDNLGGGCCIPSYVCSGPGCQSVPSFCFYAAANIHPGILNPSIAVGITTIITIGGASSSAEASTITTTPASSVPSSTTCPPSFQSCPASLGGGCCSSDRVCESFSCGPATSTTSTTTRQAASSTRSTVTATGVLPVRPTSITSSAPASTPPGLGCPGGYYACSAFYPGGCCRIGRDCSSTDCPATQSTTIISSEATIAVPVGSAATVNTQSGSCATGWASCPASLGGNCCPSGFACGTASCSSISGTATVTSSKESSGTQMQALIPTPLRLAIAMGLVIIVSSA